MTLKFGDPESIRIRDAAITPIQQMHISYGIDPNDNICVDCRYFKSDKPVWSLAPSSTWSTNCDAWSVYFKPVNWDAFNKACGKFEDR